MFGPNALCRLGVSVFDSSRGQNSFAAEWIWPLDWTFANLMWSLYIPYIHIWYVTVMLTVGQHLFFSRHVDIWSIRALGLAPLQHFRFPELSIPILLCISPMSFSAKSWNWACCIWLFSCFGPSQNTPWHVMPTILALRIETLPTCKKETAFGTGTEWNSIV